MSRLDNHRLADLLREAEFLEVRMMPRSGGPDHVQRRLEQIERELRARAADMGIEPGLSLTQLRRRLAQQIDRRKSTEAYDGPERRRGERRLPTRFRE